MKQRMVSIARRFLPELEQLETNVQAIALASVLGALYGVPLAIAGLIWLVLATDWSLVATSWPLLALLFVLHWFFYRLDFSTVLEADSVRVRGSQGRIITWSAVLLLGPGALWIEVLSALIEVVTRRHLPASTPFVARMRRWEQLRYFAVAVGRETLSILPALWLYGRLGGVTPLPTLTLAAIGPALYATLLKSGLFVLVMAPVLLLFLFVAERPSLLDQLRTFYRFWLAVAIFYLLPDPFGVLAAGLFAAGGWWVYLFFLVGIFIFSYLAHRLSRVALVHQRRTRELEEMEALTQMVLNQPAADLDLAAMLQEHVSDLLPLVWVEIRLFPDERVYCSDQQAGAVANGSSPALQPSLDESVWGQLAGSSEPYLLLRQSQAGETRDGLLVPIVGIKGDEERIGGICALPHAHDGDVLDFLPALRSLAALIAAVRYQQEEVVQALSSQAEAYQEELYAQAYQTEVYAQALAYQKVTQELAVAGQIQASFLPQVVPDVTGWQLAVTLEPARETSGDFYDFIPLQNGRIGLLVADVADKGIGSALYMALTRTLIRTFAAEHGEKPDAVLAAANHRILADTVSDLFVTVFYGVLDPDSGTLTYCNAGHNPPFLLQSQNGQEAMPLKRTAMPLGILEDAGWESGVVSIVPGDVLVMYTDGITEAQDEFEDFFGEERLQTIVRANMHRSAEVIEDKVVSAIFDFVGDAPQFDDITLMVLVRESR